MASFVAPPVFLIDILHSKDGEREEAIKLSLNDISGTLLKVTSYGYTPGVHYFCLLFPNIKMQKVKTNLSDLSLVV